MSKVLFIYCGLDDYGAISFEDSECTVEEAVEKIEETGKDSSDFYEGLFSGRIIDFDAELTERDIRILNGYIDTHNEKFYYIGK